MPQQIVLLQLQAYHNGRSSELINGLVEEAIS